MRLSVRVQHEAFDVAAEQRALHGADGQVGAVVSFVGLVRDLNEGDAVSGLFLEHYPGMTERTLERIAAQAAGRWSLRACSIIHRVGALAPLDPIVWVGVASAHRGDAFAACAFIMDFLKTEAPFWKRERGPQGERWLEARASDAEAAARWQTPATPSTAS